MTKTLTEQWHDGTIDYGLYYVKIAYRNDITIAHTIEEDLNVEEVLAPVPSYDEYCNLVFQANKPKNPLSDVMMCYDTEREKKVVERLQEQLADAIKTIDYYDKKDFHYTLDDGTVMGAEPAHKYKVKWGVK